MSSSPVNRLVTSRTNWVRRIDSRRGLGIFSSPPRQDRLCGSPSLVSNGYRELFPRGYIDRGGGIWPLT